MKKWERVEKKRLKREALTWRRFVRRGGLEKMRKAMFKHYAPLAESVFDHYAPILSGLNKSYNFEGEVFDAEIPP